MVNDSLYPAWHEEFRVLACFNAHHLRVSVRDMDMLASQEIGACEVDFLNFDIDTFGKPLKQLSLKSSIARECH